MRRFALISLGVHAVVLAGLVLWFRHGAAPDLAMPDTLPAVELVMVKAKGDGPAAPPPAPARSEAAPEPDAPPVKPPDPSDVAEPLPPPPAPPSPPPSTAQVSVSDAPGQAPAPAPLQINLGGAQDETNAIALGAQIVPAGLDARFHNQEPAYPPEAARRAEQGAVDLLVHVAPNGVAWGVDVTKSSGYPRLDEAARDAVVTWHFLPAMKGGTTIPFDMPFRVVFRLD